VNSAPRPTWCLFGPDLAAAARQAPQAGDEVITVAAGFPTTVNPIIQNGCIPVFIDAHVPTYNADVSMLEESRSDKTGR